MSTNLPLSAEAQAILRDAKAKDGRIHAPRYDGIGSVVLDAQGKYAEDAETRRRQWDALQDLLAAGLIDQLGEGWYELTREGRDLAEQL